MSQAQEYFERGLSYNEVYEQGKADGARELADRLRVNFDLYAWKNSDEVIDYTIAEWQKGAKNE